MTSHIRAAGGACIALTIACSATIDAPRTGSAQSPLLALQGQQSQGQQSQGQQSQGSYLVGNFDLKGFRANTLRKAFPGEQPSTVDETKLVEGELVSYRSSVSGTTPSLSACPHTAYPYYGYSRSCGFESAGLGRCFPGDKVKIGPGGGCEVSSGDPTVRICSGTAPCEQLSSAVLAAANHVCSPTAAPVTFTCPASGTYTVMIGAYSSFEQAQVALAADRGEYPHFNVVHRGDELSGSTIRAEWANGSFSDYRLERILPEYDAFQTQESSGYVGTTLRYEVIAEGVEGEAAWFCGGDPKDGARDYDDEAVAIPVSGWWDETGAVHREADYFTFACRRGVISKCYRWGYRPWDCADRSWEPGLDCPEDLSRAHQACTRMARADYCGDGRTFTQNGTTINLWDVYGLQSYEGAPELSFEAGWSPEGAVCLSHPRWDNAPDEVRDPIGCPAPYDDGAVEPRLCDDESEAVKQGAAAGRSTPLFNESALNHYEK